ncbi:MAG: SURF1 family protein, partial [Luteimonas sp.]|nr:SURF1 family protein [Luteimonas sp.]
ACGTARVLGLAGPREGPRMGPPAPDALLVAAGGLGGILAAVAAPQPAGQILATGLDAPGLRTQLRQPGLAPRVLKLDPAAPLGYARDLDVLPNTLPPERHLGYAVQWFALAAAVLVIALLLTFRKRKQDEATP